jgi:hypothetical protein
MICHAHANNVKVSTLANYPQTEVFNETFLQEWVASNVATAQQYVEMVACAPMYCRRARVCAVACARECAVAVAQCVCSSGVVFPVLEGTYPLSRL